MMCKNKINFITELGFTCHYKTIENLLKFYAYDMKEEFCYLFLRSYYEKDIDVNIPVFCRKAFNKIGFDLRVHRISNIDNSIKKIQNLIEKQIPVLANVDGSYLRYFPKRMAFEFKQHLIVIKGFNDNEFLVSDSYVPTYPPESYEGWINKDEIINVINHSYDQGKVFSLIPQKEGLKISEMKIYTDCIKKMLDILITENEMRCRYFEEKTIDELSKMEGNMNELLRKARGEILSNGGPAETREFFSNIYLKLADNKKSYKYYAEKFRFFSDSWVDIANAFLKCMIIHDKDRFSEKVRESYFLTKEEIEYFNKIKSEEMV